MIKKINIGFFLASVFWFLMFSPWTASHFNFWVVMVIATGSLTLLSLISDRKNLNATYYFSPKWFLIGVLAAIGLYLLFFVGNIISEILFDFTKTQVTNIYSTKEQAEKYIIGALLFFWIGPAEEIFWRGFAQKYLSEKYGDWKGFFITLVIYAFVHIWAFNFMLFMAALIAGAFWGLIYMKYKNIWPGIISHALWDLFIFVIIPIQ